MPAVLVKYRLEAALWHKLGLRLDDFDDRPRRELDRYLQIMQLEEQIERQRAELQQTKARATQQGR